MSSDAAGKVIRHPAENRAGDEELFSEQFIIEQKMFYIDLKRNKNGMYVKVSEKSGGRRHNVLVPASGLDEVLRALTEAKRKIEEASV